MSLTHGELFAGISGFGLGFSYADIKTLWHVEIDGNCQKVLRRHYPGTLLLSDVRDCGAHNLPQVDVVSFGSPCQDLSIAGKRAGLKNGEKSNLFFEAIRIVDELKPTFAVWENVPGSYSSNSGRDFANVLAAFRDIGARDIAWTCLDAQYFGVAQRRRRVFLVADFRGERAAEILFESESLPGHPPPGREAGEKPAYALAASVRGTGDGHGQGWNTTYVTGFDRTRGMNSGRIAGPLRACEARAEGVNDGKADAQCVAYQYHGGDVGRMGTLRRGKEDVQSGVPFIANAFNGYTGGADDNDAQAGHIVAFDWQSGGDVRLNVSSKHTSALQANQTSAVLRSSVRRLTPTECERLQGFPDGWTAWGMDENGRRVEMSDTARYKILGNAVAVPVAEWIGQRIMKTKKG